MRDVTEYLRQTQEELYSDLSEAHAGKTAESPGRYLLVPGDAPMMLVAHLDTAHATPVRAILDDGDILASPQGIGGDDRCGVCALESLWEDARVKPWLLYTCDEETGRGGAKQFASDARDGVLDEALADELRGLKLIAEVDRRGLREAVYYRCANPAFEERIRSYGFLRDHGTGSDISDIAPALGVAAVNVSAGYHDEHTIREKIRRSHLADTIQRLAIILEECVDPSFPAYAYMEAPGMDDPRRGL